MKPYLALSRQHSVRCILPLVLALLSVSVRAQDARTMLKGHVRAELRSANDLGRVDASLHLEHATLVLQTSAAQQKDLQDLLARQQDPASADYHRWLTPEQYGARFGLAQGAIDGVTSWLAGQNIKVDSVATGRNTIAFSGAVRDVEKAFQTEIHQYSENGEAHFANAIEPSIPASLGAYIQVVRGLDNFRLKPRLTRPSYTSTTTGNHYLAPDDVATIFDIAPLYNSGVTGKGQSIVVVGQTKINLSDIQSFRTYFNLSANDPKTLLVPGTTDPGISSADLPEADLDIEWSGAVARDASILYLYSPNVDISLQYAIDHNLAPVITMSYGLCEGLTGTAGVNTYDVYAKQASSQGISWMAASGDNGADDCYGQSNRAPFGLSVDAPASTPLVTAVGGTTLNEAAGTYWTSNNSNHASALSYIPETAWNDSVASGSLLSSGGGVSGYFLKPAWQLGTTIATDTYRDVPDIAMPASANHDAYMVYSGGAMVAYGGTSVAAPVFAGIAGLLNHYLTANGFHATAGLGSMNARLYAMAQISPNAFHDVTTGDNMVVPCATRACASQPLVGYTAGVGYDQVTGLGSVDAFNLVTAWHQLGSSARGVSSIQLSSSLAIFSATDATNLTVTLAVGPSAPTGTVTFYLQGVALGSTSLTTSGQTSTATFLVTGATLSAGTPLVSLATDGSGTPVITPTITAIYTGDNNYAAASASLTVTVFAPNALVMTGLSNAASFKATYAPGMIAALFGQNLASGIPPLPPSPLPSQLGEATVTINGIPAPLYYASPTQINLQIPYEISGSATAIVKITSGGQTATSQISIASAAPGIFADTNSLLVPHQSTGRGQTIALYMTGEGLVTPLPVTGSTPAPGAVPTIPTNAKLVISVGGIATTTTFVGIPSWSVGVTQINFTIPSNAPLGLQKVIVTVRNVASAPVYITVTQ